MENKKEDKIIKRYKRCPKHKYWKSGKDFIKLEHLGSELNKFTKIENVMKRTFIISGFNVCESFIKIPESEYNLAAQNIKE
jgi:hypothetical protein